MCKVFALVKPQRFRRNFCCVRFLFWPRILFLNFFLLPEAGQFVLRLLLASEVWAHDVGLSGYWFWVFGIVSGGGLIIVDLCFGINRKQY